MSKADCIVLQGSCVAVKGAGVLLRGAPGTGKSDLALRLIDSGAALVSDDYVTVLRKGPELFAEPPATIAGLLEIRGAGILSLAGYETASLRLVVDLVPPQNISRLPEPVFEPILGLSVPKVLLAAFEASTPAKIRMILYGLAANAFRQDQAP